VSSDTYSMNILVFKGSGGFVNGILLSAGNYHGSPLLTQKHSYGPANTFTGASHDGDLVGEFKSLYQLERIWYS
jgi:hypothetical protein